MKLLKRQRQSADCPYRHGAFVLMKPEGVMIFTQEMSRATYLDMIRERIGYEHRDHLGEVLRIKE